MCRAEIEGEFQSGPQPPRCDQLHLGEQCDIRQIFYASVRACARHGIHVELLGDVRFDWIYLYR